MTILSGRQKTRHELRLYVAGTTPKSLRAVQNIKRICDAELADQYDLEIVDVYKEPGRLAKDQVVAIPTLVKLSPGATKRLIGDLSQEAQVRKGLGFLAA